MSITQKSYMNAKVIVKFYKTIFQVLLKYVFDLLIIEKFFITYL